MLSRIFRRLADYKDPRSLGFRLRQRRARHLRRLIAAAHARRGACAVLDVGGTEAFWATVGADFMDAHDVTVTLLNIQPTRSSPDPASVP